MPYYSLLNNNHMQTMYKKTFAATVLLVVLSIPLFSFFSAPGGDKFEIYLNNKLVLEQYVSTTMSPRFISLAPDNYNSKIDIYYKHCGLTGKNRALILKDANNKVIKKWQFTNTGAAMTLKGKDIMDFQKDNTKTLRLFYSSAELPQGRLLATVGKAESYARMQ
jgi:hypothetical protein